MDGVTSPEIKFSGLGIVRMSSNPHSLDLIFSQLNKLPNTCILEKIWETDSNFKSEGYKKAIPEIP
jgi:hypothetical protein